VGDFNNDGQLDVVIRNQAAFGHSYALSVLLNNGTGSFATAPTYAAGMLPVAIAAGDFTGDGLPDLVTADFAGEAHILINNGDGTFHSGDSLSTPDRAKSVAVGDFTGNGKADIAVMSTSTGAGRSQVEVFLGNGDGTFQSGQTVDLGDHTGSNYGNIVAGDFDGDGRLDLGVLFRNTASQQSFVEVLLGNGDGTFRAATPRVVDPAGSPPTSLVAGDFHHNGKLDLVTANVGDGFGRLRMLFELPGNGDGTFQDAVRIPAPGGPVAVTAADLSGDGNLDLITADTFTNTVSVLRSHGAGTFDPAVSYPVGVSPAALVVGNFNGDGIPGVAVVNSFSSTVSVLRGNGDGTLQPAVHQLVGLDPGALVAADFNGDGTLDLAVANIQSHDVSVLLNQGGGGLAPSTAGRAALLARGLVEVANRGERQWTTAVADMGFAASQLEEVLPARALTDVGLLSHHHRDRGEALDAAGAADPLEEVG
jgi:hypothetical protein